MKPATRRPLVVAIVIALAALMAVTVTGAASATVRPKPAPVVAPVLASTVVPVGRVSSLVVASASTPMTEVTRSASRAVAANQPPCAITARACVDLGARKAWLTDGNGTVLFGPVGVLGGRSGEPTPVGTFSVSRKVRDYHSRQFDAPMPYSVFFQPGIAFHTGSLSTRSAGCLHLANASAKRFFADLAPGDEVQVVS